MFKNFKFKFEDDYFSTAFLILATVGWFSLSIGSNGNSGVNYTAINASIAPIAPANKNTDTKKSKKQEQAAKVKVAAAAEATPVVAKIDDKQESSISEQAARDLNALAAKVNNKAGETVVVYDNAGPTEKLHVDAAFILLTDKRPRVSSEKSRIIAPAIVAFTLRKKVIAYIDADATAPESYIQALEKYIQSYNNLKVERRILTTAQKQLELTLEVQ